MNREETSLTAALRAVPGVADAELAADTAEGVRVRLAPEADPTDVAAAVRDVLADYGLRGRMAPPQARIEPAGPPPPPPESATILPGPGLLQTTLIQQEPVEDERPDADAEQVEIEEPEKTEQVIDVAVDSPAPVASPVGVSTMPSPADGSDVSELAGKGLLSQVRVQEDRAGVAVTVETDDGRSVTRRGRPSDAGVREAVVAAVGELSGDQPPPVLAAVEEYSLGDQQLVTVLLQRHDGSFHVGSALIGAEKAFALARAAWAAMSQAG